MTRRSFASLALFAPFFGLVVSACGADDGASLDTTNGVDDVAEACSIRAQWTQSTANPCTECLALAPLPRCECATQEYAGRCSAQQTAKNGEPECEDVSDCVVACPSGDCACVDACYAERTACRSRASALDGCVAEVCDAFCR